MKINKSKNKIIIITILLLVALGIAGYVLVRELNTKKVAKIAETTNLKPDQAKPAIVDEGQSSGRNNANNSTGVPAPILYKSSGNNGPVPAGAVIEFVCQSQAGVKCDVILTEQSTGQSIALGEKAVQEGRGQSGTSWEWTSQKGSWKVVAKTTSNTGVVKQSTPQTLTVQ